ncbi:MAG: glycosyltransferase [Candidatus Micrarchaeota archaeon]|nr:glycosyltransferase [Candidatus Micrarchaeota archaeon]
MNIAMFTDSYLPNTDGVVTSIINYRKGLEKEGHRMIIFAPDSPMAKKEAGVYRYAAVPFPPYPEYRAAIFPYVPADIAKKNSISLVHCKAMVSMGVSAFSFANRAKLPSIASLETMIPEGAHYIVPSRTAERIGRKIGWAYLRWLYRHFELITAPSKHAQRILAENKIDSEILPSPIDTDRFFPSKNCAELKKRLGLEGKKVAIAVGRVVKEKNYSFLVSVAKEMKDSAACFLIVGKGPYMDELKQQAWKEGVFGMFKFAGFVEDSLLPDYYNAADAMIFPSSFETQGLAHLEAMACGKPACVLEGTPMQEVIVEGKNGRSFQYDPKECAEKLADCIEKSGRMAKAARKTALGFSIPACTARLLRLYQRLLE